MKLDKEVDNVYAYIKIFYFSFLNLFSSSHVNDYLQCGIAISKCDFEEALKSFNKQTSLGAPKVYQIKNEKKVLCAHMSPCEIYTFILMMLIMIDS